MNASLIAAYAKSNPAAARQIFDAAIANTTDADSIANLELLREYFCNGAFREAMADEVAARV